MQRLKRFAYDRANSSQIFYPAGIRRDAAGNFLIAETKNLRVRAISAFAGLDASAGNLAFGAVPVGYTSSPQTLVLTGVGPLEISSISTTEDFIEYDEAISLTGTSQ